VRAAERLFGQHDDLARFLRPAGVGGAASASGLLVRHRFGSPPAATVRFSGPVYVLGAFQKKSKKGRETPKAEIELIQGRLREAERVTGVERSAKGE
jgi:hypothetical protein